MKIRSSINKATMIFSVLFIVMLIAEAGYCVEFPRETLLKNDTEPLSSSSFRIVTPSDKDPTVAFFTAFVPGFFVHGLGQYYIGDNSTGTVLLGMEVLSLGLFIASSDMSIMENQEESEEDHSFARGSAYVLFFGSWIYDFIGAPIKASKTNKNYSYYIFPDCRDDRLSVKLAINWK